MPPGRARRPAARTDPATENRRRGLLLIRRHPLFARLAQGAVWHDGKDDGPPGCPPDGWAVVTSHGHVYLHRTRRGEPEEWAWVAAHCLLHLGFGHLAEQHHESWTAAAGLPPAPAGPGQAPASTRPGTSPRARPSTASSVT